MNERIFEMIQAQNANRGLLWTECDKEEFAELIIQKSIAQIALIGISNFENEDISWTVETAIVKIEEHFGVQK